MKSLLKRILLVSTSVMLVLFCLTGCMQTSSNVNFKMDGSFDYSVDYRIRYDAFGEGEEGKSSVASNMETWRNTVEQKLSAVIEDTSDEEYGGIKFTANFKDVPALDESEIAVEVAGLVAPTLGGTDGAMLKMFSSDHVFYKEYQIVGEIPNFLNYFGVDPSAISEAERAGAYQSTFSVTVPFTFLTDGNNSKAEGNTLIWEGNPVSLDSVPVEFSTVVLTLWGWIALGVILLAIVVLIIVLIVKKAKKNDAEEIVYDEFGNPVVEDVEEDAEAVASAEREFYQGEEVVEEIKEIIEDSTSEIVEETVEELTEEIVEDLSEELTEE